VEKKRFRILFSCLSCKVGEILDKGKALVKYESKYAKGQENCQLLFIGEKDPFEDGGKIIFYAPYLTLTFAYNSRGGGKRTTATPSLYAPRYS